MSDLKRYYLDRGSNDHSGQMLRRADGKWTPYDEAERALLQARADAAAAHEKGMDDAADKILDWLAKAVGAEKYSPCDGSETWDGDVHGTIYAILKAGGVYDDEDGRVAKLADAAAAQALMVERANKQLAAARETFCYASPGSDEEFTSLLLGFDTAAGIVGTLAPDAGTDELARLREALGDLRQWCNAYPVAVFPEPDLKCVAEVLKDAGLTLDAVSASNFRHVLKRVREITDAALLPVVRNELEG